MQMPLRNMFRFILGIIVLLISLTSLAQAESKTYKKTLDRYNIPDVTLINQDGKRVQFKSIMESDRPVVLNFIFGTCTTICPVLSAGYINLQQKLGTESTKVRLISISIDPENDSPKVMKEYLKRYRAKPGWDFLTGSRKDIDTVMRAFDAYIPNKMSHYALTLIHPPKEDKWTRIYGIMSSSEFVAETKKAGL